MNYYKGMLEVKDYKGRLFMVYYSYSPPSNDYFDVDFGNWMKGDDLEIDILKVVAILGKGLKTKEIELKRGIWREYLDEYEVIDKITEDINYS